MAAQTAFGLASSVSEGTLALFLMLPVPIQGVVAVGGASSFFPHYPPWYTRKRLRYLLERSIRRAYHRKVWGRDEPSLGGTIDFIAAGRVYRPHWRSVWKTKAVWHGKIRTCAELEVCLLRYPRMSRFERGQAARWIASLLQNAGERGSLHDFNIGAPRVVRQFLAPFYMFSVKEGGGLPAAALDYCDFSRGWVTYATGDGMLGEEDFKKRILDFERIWGEKVVIETLRDGDDQPVPGFIVVRSYPKLPEIIALAPIKYDVNLIELGVNVSNGRPIAIGYDEFLHLAVQGITGNGKTKLLRALLAQLLTQPRVKKITLVDFKGGIDFADLKDNPKVEMVHDWAGVNRVVKECVDDMEDRLPDMVARGITRWPDGDHWIVVDEFAYMKRQGEAGARLINMFTDIGQRGRAPGFRLVCATQQMTVDAIPSQLRNCLELKICFCVETVQIAGGMFGGTSGLLADPTKLAIGQFQTFVHAHQAYYHLKGYGALQ